MELIPHILSIALFVPFVAWGVYTLRLRYKYQMEFRPTMEALTLAGLVVFYAFELALLRTASRPMSPYFIFAVLGLFTSGVALYGPMLTSLASQVLVDQMMPAERSQTHEPNYASAEACESAGDYAGAVREYKAVARVFPRDAVAMIRIADNLAKQDQLALAVPWFESGLECLDSPEKNLGVTNRLAEMYAYHFDRKNDAVRVLRTYLKRFPESSYAESVRRRIEGLERAAGTA
jgi:tetratricopeptide (TPR) repeat protein